MLSIVQSRINEYSDAVKYTMTTLKNNKQAAVILEHAEIVKKIEKKLKAGEELSSEDSKICKSVDGELLFGYSEAERLKKFDLVASVLDKELKEIMANATKVQEATKRAKSEPEKKKI